MIRRDVIQDNYKNKRYAVDSIQSFIDSEEESYGKILVLFGLRRTGKTTMMEQVMVHNSPLQKCAFYEVQQSDSMDNVFHVIKEEQKNGTTIIFFDEITKATDFTTDSALLPDIYAKEGIKIIVSGTDSLGFVFADNSELYDRTLRIRTTHIPFAEHSKILGTTDIDDYISYGGLMKPGESEDQVHDLLSAKKYLDSSVSLNISLSIKKDPRNNILKKLSHDEIQTIINKLVEIYSGTIDKDVIMNEIKKVSVNRPIDLLSNKDNIDYDEENIPFLKSVSVQRRDIVKDFVHVLKLDKSITTEISDNMLLKFEQYLIDMDLLSAVSRKEFNYRKEFGWMENPVEKDFYIIQPAIKYYHLKEGKRFIEKESYYENLPQNLKKIILDKLDQTIKGDMIEQIVLFDVSKTLSQDNYIVFKTQFNINAENKGEYDMFIYDIEKNKHWAFEIKHTTEPYYNQEKHICNSFFTDFMESRYGKREGACVLYRGHPFKSSLGTFYFNITDFLVEVEKYHNVENVFENLSKNLVVENPIERDFTKEEKENVIHKFLTSLNDKTGEDFIVEMRKKYNEMSNEKKIGFKNKLIIDSFINDNNSDTKDKLEKNLKKYLINSITSPNGEHPGVS